MSSSGGNQSLQSSTSLQLSSSLQSRLAVIPEDEKCKDVVDLDIECTPTEPIRSARTVDNLDLFIKTRQTAIDEDASPASTQCETPVNTRGLVSQPLTTTSNVFGSSPEAPLVRSISLQPSRTGGTASGTNNDLMWCPSRTNLSAELRRRLSEQVIRTCERQRSESAMHFASWKESKWGEDQFDFGSNDFKSGFDLGVVDAFDFILVAKKLRSFIDQMQIAIWSATRDAVDCPRRQVSDCPKRADRCPKRKRKRKVLENIAGEDDTEDYTHTPTPPIADVGAAGDGEQPLHSAAATNNQHEIDVPFSLQPLTGCVH